MVLNRRITHAHTLVRVCLCMVMRAFVCVILRYLLYVILPCRLNYIITDWFTQLSFVSLYVCRATGINSLRSFIFTGLSVSPPPGLLCVLCQLESSSPFTFHKKDFAFISFLHLMICRFNARSMHPKLSTLFLYLLFFSFRQLLHFLHFNSNT